jgi:putative spermidine/putrescine transport system ATP-binding protein
LTVAATARGASLTPISSPASLGAAVELVGLVKRYGEGPAAVDDVNLEVAPGEFVTLLGPSGSGKTTTLMAIAGFVGVTSGDILLDGRSVLSKPSHKRDIGVVFQNYALFPHMTVAANIGFPLKARRWAKDRIRTAVDEALALVRLDDFGERYPAQLSGGQQQRVALARATVYRPKLLLMDEPLGALDRQLRQAMQFEITNIRSTLGVTVISVTHDQEEALSMSDRVVVMREGSLIQAGSPRSVYERPAAAFVAGFVGETNLFSGVASAAGDKISEVRVDDRLTFTVAGSATVGDEVLISIRPERFRMTTTTSAAGVNTFTWVVEGCAYTGGASRYVVRVGGQQVVVRIPTADDELTPRLGEEVAIVVAPDDVVLVQTTDDN